MRDRPKDTIANFYASVLIQTVPCKLIVVDYGSTPENVEWERRVFGKDLIVVKNYDPIFNIAHANNIGIRKAKTPWVMTCGIDMIFSDNLIEWYLKVVTNDDRALVGCTPTFIGKDKREYLGPRRICCVCFNRHWLNSVQGYDERFHGWGCEDDDIRSRAIADGYHLVDVHPRAFIKHQYHEILRVEKHVDANRHYHLKPGKPRKRNENGWGICSTY